MAAQAEPPGGGDQLRARQRGGVGAAHEVGDKLADRPWSATAAVSTLIANASTRSEVAEWADRASCAAAWARLRPPAEVASVTRDHSDRSVGRRGIVRSSTNPRGIGTDVLGDPRVLVEDLLPSVAARRAADRSHPCQRGDHHGVDRARITFDTAANCSAVPSNPSRCRGPDVDALDSARDERVAHGATPPQHRR